MEQARSVVPSASLVLSKCLQCSLAYRIRKSRTVIKYHDPMPNEPTPPLTARLAKIAVVVLIGGYLGLLGLNLGRQILGDPAPAALGYFFTWDMFPFYHAWSSRRTAIGKTAAGRYVEIVPAGAQRYRGGADGNLTRADLDRGENTVRKLADQTLAHTHDIESDPVTQVWLLEEFWPEKMNLPSDLYEEFWGTSKPERTYWRRIADYETPRAEQAKRNPAGERP